MTSCVCANFAGRDALLRIILAKLEGKIPNNNPLNVQPSESQFPHFNGSFTKGFLHDANGELVNDQDFIRLVSDLLTNNQVDLAAIPLAPLSTSLLTDPMAGNCSCLVGAGIRALTLPPPFLLNSNEAAAEMVELYAQALARDIPFANYATDATIQNLSAWLSLPNIQQFLPSPPVHSFTSGLPIIPQNIFRGSFPLSDVGPYVSQLLLLNVPLGALTVPLIHSVPSVSQNWCTNHQDTVNCQNGILTGLAPVPPTVPRYICDGRGLAELCHQDASIEYYYFAANVLAGLNVPWNAGFPQYVNQSQFLTLGSGNAVQHALAELCSLSLKHAWFWKFLVYRKLRPEAFGLAVDNVINHLVSNQDYHIAPWIFADPTLNAVFLQQGSYTLSGAFREGCPGHPSYPSGHAVVAGACCTLLKMFFNAQTPWSSIIGLQAATLNHRIVPSVSYTTTVPVLEAQPSGVALQSYTGADIAQMTVASEINKMGMNIAFGRNWAGIHYRTDAMEGMLLGEQIAQAYMKDVLSSFVQKNLNGTNIVLSFQKLDGTTGSVTSLV